MTFKKGHKHSEKIRRKISEAHKGKKPKPFTKETRKRMSQAKKGMKFSEEHRRNIGLAKMGEKNPMYGKTLSEKRKREHSQRMSGEKHPMYGKTLSEEHRRKISKTTKGRKLPEKTRRKMSEAQKGHVVLEKTRRKIGSKNKGRIMSEEFRQKKRKDRAKQRLPTYDTLPEKLLQKLCKEAEIEFQTQKDFNLGFQNHPVDVFIEPNICIEADGDFIHANPHPHLIPSRSSKIQSGYKPDKIIKHKLTAKWIHEHDAKINQALEQQGNVVLRFWHSELETEPKKCLQKIIKIIKEAKRI